MSLFSTNRRNHEQVHISSELVGGSIDKISDLEEEVLTAK